MLNLYSSGGAMEKAGLQQIERAKTGATTSSMQRDIGRGLYGIRPYEQEWEATTGAGAVITLEDVLSRGRAAILGQQASVVERIENKYPDLNAVSQAYGAAGSVGGSSTSSGIESPIVGTTGQTVTPGTVPQGQLSLQGGGSTTTQSTTTTSNAYNGRTYPGMYQKDGVWYVGTGKQRGRVTGWPKTSSRPYTTPDPE